MDLFDEIKGVVESHNKTLLAGLKSGEDIGSSRALGKVVDQINRMLDATGHSGLENIGFRKALVCVRAYIHAELRP